MGDLLVQDKEAEQELALLKPFQLGPFKLAHRIVYAPLTRDRAIETVPQAQAALYYSQRTTPGGLLITEANGVRIGSAFPETPGLWTQEQVEAWKPIVKAVHDKGGIFFSQLWHTGRANNHIWQPNGAKPISSTSRTIKNGIPNASKTAENVFASEPRALETDEIPGLVNDFVLAAKNARAAGFDGVELHGAHGYLLDQFMKSGINDRTDKYGGSLENRARFVLEIVEAVADAIGADRVGVRISPFASALGEATDSDPAALAVYMAEELNKRKILYLHCVEPRWNARYAQESEHTLWPIRKAFTGGAFFGAGGYTRETGNKAVQEGEIDAAVYGRLFLANPDLVKRFKLNAPLNNYIRDTFYSQDQVVGYTDYPFLEESHPEFAKS